MKFQDKSDYIIDIAAERVYDSQGERYHRDYTEWRNTPGNRFAYSFIHDSREHIYVKGEGYADRSALEAEKKSLHSCLQFLGKMMIIYLLFQIALYIIMRTMFDTPFYGWIYRTAYLTAQENAGYDISAVQTFVYCGIRIVSFIAMLAMCVAALRLPLSVAVPKEPPRPALAVFGFSIMLSFLVISSLFSYILTNMFSAINLDVSYYFYPDTDDTAARAVYFITELVIVPILSETVFRGYILQLFRQFGDPIAILISAVCSACCYHDIIKLLTVFMLSLLLGMITVKSGSLFPSIITKTGFVAGQYLIYSYPIDYSNNTVSLIHALVCIFVLMVSFNINARIRKKIYQPFKLSPSDTEMSFMTKMRLALTSNALVAWLILTLIVMILNLQVI